MEELIRECVMFFLNDMNNRNNRYYTLKKHYLFVLEKTTDKEYCQYIKNWMFLDSIKEIKDKKYNEIELEIFEILNYYYKKFFKIASKYFEVVFLVDDFSFCLAKNLIELYGEHKFKNAPNYFIDIEDGQTFSNNFNEKDFLLFRILVQDKICENKDFLKICDKIPIDDLIRNINILESINAEALFKTLINFSDIKNKGCLFVLITSIVSHSIRSSILHYGFLKEEPEDFSDLF